jgi:predicted permease
MILSVVGAVLGSGVSLAIVGFLARETSISLPLLNSVRFDSYALGWTLLMLVVAGLTCGLGPALRISVDDLQAALKDGGHGSSEGRKHEHLRSVLVISEIALSCVLLAGAGLLLRSFLRVLDVDLGFEPARAATMRIDVPGARDAGRRMAIWQDVLHRVEAIPGVESAGLTDNLPLGRNRSWRISAKGKEYRDGELGSTYFYVISPGYLRSIGMRLVSGRDFNWADTPDSEKVVIVNQTVARRLWPQEDPIGRIAVVGNVERRVVGVIADVSVASVEGDAGWQMYLPATQHGPDGASLVIRSSLPPNLLRAPILGALRQINSEQPMMELRPLQQTVDQSISPRRFFVGLVLGFAGLGLLLASIGIYGVISYSVTRQTQAIGIRMALGATQGNIQRSVLAKTLKMSSVGIAIGVITSIAVGKLIASQLFQIAPTDATTFLSVILAMVSVALLAGYVPARRASRTDPMNALRTG